MAKYIGRITFEINGSTIDDIRTVTVRPTPKNKRIELMNKDGYVEMVQSYDLEVVYVIPSGVTEFDFESVVEGTAVVDRGDGTREQYGGVTFLENGDTAYDRGADGATKTVLLMATSKN